MPKSLHHFQDICKRFFAVPLPAFFDEIIDGVGRLVSKSTPQILLDLLLKGELEHSTPINGVRLS